MSRRLLLATGMAAAVAAGVIHSSPARAQTAALKPGEELRPLYATVDDIADGRRLAESSCVGCHGANGISTTPGTPNLAGQRPAYLYLELKAYQAGRRDIGAMTNAVKFLSDDALVKVSAYYASLDPAQPAAAAASPAADPVQAGKAAAAGCGGCHGETGVSATPTMPSLAGLSPQYLVAAMQAYRGGQRANDTMKALIAPVSDADMNNIALFYALQKPARAQTPASGDRAAGKTAAAACAGCHGNEGVSANPTTPSLAGQDAQYLADALVEYKNGSRGDETMKGLASPLDERAIKDLAAYYAALEPQAPVVAKPLSVDQWAQRCNRCHGPGGNSTDPRYPALAAQRADYLEKVLHAYRTRERRSPEMAAMSDALSDDDIKNLAAHYARQKARAVVFVTVPSK
ncbi:MAG TPA: c-type cytochrome [Xanthobacteraceae bacterium]|nr:c-type cytochrome [Xanthobacteraceae bacterium]